MTLKFTSSHNDQEVETGMGEKEDNTVYKVIVNHEEQYSHMAGRQRQPARLEGCRQERKQG
jgi:uncharacterized protein YbdZ (MbtH family)